MSDRKHYTRICKDCGRVVHNTAPNMIRCPNAPTGTILPCEIARKSSSRSA